MAEERSTLSLRSNCSGCGFPLTVDMPACSVCGVMPPPVASPYWPKTRILLTAMLLFGLALVYSVWSSQSAPPPPSVRTGSWLLEIVTSGPGKSDAMRSIPLLQERVERALPRLQEIYAEALKNSPALKGAITLELTISWMGEVTEVFVHPAPIADEVFRRSIQTEAQNWQFPSTLAGEVKVFYPLVFWPTNDDPEKVQENVVDILPGQYKILGGKESQVFKAADTQAPVIAIVKPGKQVKVIGIEGKEWVKILSPQKDIVGYLVREAVVSPMEKS